MSLIQRSARIAGTVAVCLAVFIAAAQAQTAEELLTQGLEQLTAGQVAAALETLESIDPAELASDEQRQTLQKTIDQLRKSRTTRQTLASALKAEKAGDYDRAIELYKSVTSDEAATRAARQEALIGLARSERARMAPAAPRPVNDQISIDDVNTPRNVEPLPIETEIQSTGPASTISDVQPAEPTVVTAPAPQPVVAPQPEPEPVVEPTTIVDVVPEPAPQPIVNGRSHEIGPLVDTRVNDEPTTVAHDGHGRPAVTGDGHSSTVVEPAGSDNATTPDVDERYIEPATPTTITVAEPTTPEPVAPVAKEPTNDDPNKLIEQARALYAQKLVAEGAQHFEAGQFSDAHAKYTEALRIDPDNAAAKQGLDKTSTAAARTPAGAGVLDQEIAKRKLERQRAVARYEQAMQEATEKLAAGSYAQATSAAALAKAILDTKRQYLPEAEFTAKRQAAETLAAEIDAAKESARIEEIRQQQAEEKLRNEAEREKLEVAKEKKVRELLVRARDFSREQRYELALEQLEQVLFLDPQNGAAQFMSDLIKDQILNERMKSVLDARRRNFQEQKIENTEQMVPINDLITYPPDWPQLTETRLSDLGRGGGSEVDRVAREKLQQPVPIDFQANQFANVIEYLRNVTGANFFVQWNAMEAAGITRDTPVTMQLQSVAAEKALTLILDEVGGNLVPLGYTIDDGIVVIATREFLASKREIRTYDIRDLILQIPSFDEAPQFNLEDVAADAGGGGQGSIFSDISEDDSASLSRADRILQVQDLIRNSVDPDNWRSVGARPEIASSMEELNGTLIVNTTTENHTRITQLLGQLREQRALQISVDTRFLSVTDNFLEEVGLDVDFLINRPDGALSIAQGSASANATGAGIDPGTALLSATSTAFSNFAPAFQVGTGGIGAVTGGLSLFLDDLEVRFLLTATQMDQRSTLVNTPRLTFFNGQRAFVTVSQQTAFVSDLEPVVANNAIAFDPEVDVISDGVVLDLEGTISADRRYVTLTARPSLARVRALTPFQVFGAGGTQGLDNDVDGTTDEDPVDGVDNDLDGEVDEDPPEPIAAGVIQQPVVDLTTLRTTVSVPDKGTLLLGGQRVVSEQEIEAGVPVLSKIPLINRLFTNRAISRDEQTLLILVRPTIIVQSEQEERLFPGLNQAPGLYNLGGDQ